MKILKKILIILIIAATIFTVVKCNRTEDVGDIKQEQGDDTLPKEEKDEDDKQEEQDKDDKKDKQDKEEEKSKEDKEKEEIESPVELG